MFISTISASPGDSESKYGRSQYRSLSPRRSGPGPHNPQLLHHCHFLVLHHSASRINSATGLEPLRPSPVIAQHTLCCSHALWGNPLTHSSTTPSFFPNPGSPDESWQGCHAPRRLPNFYLTYIQEQFKRYELAKFILASGLGCCLGMHNTRSSFVGHV